MGLIKNKGWRDYLWIASAIYLVLGFVNILFAWLGIICFTVPLAISLIKGNKAYCNYYCGRGQLFSLLGKKLKLSRQKDMPLFFRRNWFRYLFLAFFMLMFFNMIYTTYLVYSGAQSLREAVTLLWTIKLPWHWANSGNLAVAPWVKQFAFGFYSVMLTSTVIGLITMVLFKPRAWCVFCPMGTMTQGICRLKNSSKPEKTRQI